MASSTTKFSRGTYGRANAAAMVLTVALAQPCLAESSLRFPVPSNFGTIPVATYDIQGQPIGKASIALEWLDPETIRLTGTAAVDTGGHTRVEADFRLVDEKRFIKPIRQLSRSVTREGRSLGTLLVEHEKGTASCTPPPGSSQETRLLEIPRPDRVANVPLHFLFTPLAQGQTDTIAFDVLLCRDNPRFMEFEAVVARRSGSDSQIHNVEIRYGPDLGALLSLVVGAMMPDLRFWLGGEDDDRYLAHRMPLYADGPEIWVVRDGVDPLDLTGGSPPENDPKPLAQEGNHEARSHPAGR